MSLDGKLPTRCSAFFFALLVLTNSAFGKDDVGGFNCDATGKADYGLICSDGDLRNLNSEMLSAFNELMPLVKSKNERKVLIAKQVSWKADVLHRRSDKAYLMSEFKKRIRYYELYASPSIAGLYSMPSEEGQPDGYGGEIRSVCVDLLVEANAEGGLPLVCGFANKKGLSKFGAIVWEVLDPLRNIDIIEQIWRKKSKDNGDSKFLELVNNSSELRRRVELGVRQGYLELKLAKIDTDGVESYLVMLSELGGCDARRNWFGSGEEYFIYDPASRTVDLEDAHLKFINGFKLSLKSGSKIALYGDSPVIIDWVGVAELQEASVLVRAGSGQSCVINFKNF